MQNGLHCRLTQAEYTYVARDNAAACQLVQVRHRTILEHRFTLTRRTGQHDDMCAVSFERTARCGAPVVLQRHAALRQPCLLFIVRRHLTANVIKESMNACKRLLIERHFLSKYPCQRLLGQVVQRRP